MASEIRTIGEIVESSTTEFAAESRELHAPPPFGSFVKIASSSSEGLVMANRQTPVESGDPFDEFRGAAGSFGPAYGSAFLGEPTPPNCAALHPAIYAVVYSACTGPCDPGRRLRAFWKDEEQLSAEQPELSEWLLLTHFKALIIGHSLEGVMRQVLPPRPPRIFSPVVECADSEIRALSGRMDFLRTLVNFRGAPAEEMTAACIREAHRASGGDEGVMVSAGRELAELLKDDYGRLQAIIRRVLP